MTDNLTTQSTTSSTLPVGSIIATDEVSGAHYQKVKLDVGGDGATVPASGDATYGLDVDVTRVAGLGDLLETAPATDTASSGLNGRLQRIAQRLTNLIDLIPVSLGQKARASSLAVTLSTEDLAALVPATGVVTLATTSTATADTTLQNAVNATGNGSSLTVTGYGTALLQVSGTFVGTVTFEASSNAGTTWTNIAATQIGSDIVLSTTTTGLFRITCAGFDLIRARVTWTSGTSVTVVGRATSAPHSAKLVKLATGTNSIGTIQISDGTQTANTYAGDSNQNTLLVSGGRKDSGSQALSTTTYGGVDVSNFSWVTVQCTAYTSGTLTWQSSNDNINWVGMPLTLANALTTTAAPQALTGAATGMWHGPLTGRYFRVTGGVATIFVSFFSQVRGSLVTSAYTSSTTSTVGATLSPATSGGLTIYRKVSEANNNAIRVKSGAGQVYGWVITNTNASPRYVKLYDSTTSPPVPNTTAVALTLMIPGNSTGTGMVAAEFTMGIAFASGIGLAIMQGAADSDVTSVSANEVIVNLFYK